MECSIRAQMHSRLRSTLSTWTKSTARMPRACAVRNCFHVGPVRRSMAHPGIMQHLPNGGGGDRVAEFDEFALHAPVPPHQIVRGDADHERADGGCRGQPTGTASAGVVPFAVTRHRCQASSVAGVTAKTSPHRRRGSSVTVLRATAGRPAGSGPGRSGGAAPRSRAGPPGARHPWTPHAGPAPSGSRADGARRGRRLTRSLSE